jgi:hypothetical protein
MQAGSNFVGYLVKAAAEQTDRRAPTDIWMTTFRANSRVFVAIANEQIFRQICHSLQKNCYFNRRKVMAELYHCTFLTTNIQNYKGDTVMNRKPPGISW